MQNDKGMNASIVKTKIQMIFGVAVCFFTSIVLHEKIRVGSFAKYEHVFDQVDYCFIALFAGCDKKKIRIT